MRIMLRIAVAIQILCSTLTVAASETKRVTIDGHEFAYVEQGHGDPVLLVHGGLQDYRYWQALQPELAHGYRVVAYSRRNRFPFPLREDGAPDGAGDLHGDDLAALVRALGLGRVHVVGHSSGALAALFFALRHPEMVRSLSLNEPPAVGLVAGAPDGPDLLRDQGVRLGPAREAFKARDLDRAVRLFIDGVRGPGAFESQSETDRRMAADNALSHLADQITARPRAPFGCAEARRVETPTLLTGGERSARFFGRILDELQRCLPRVERVTITAASHNVPSDNPDAYREAVLGFIGRH